MVLEPEERLHLLCGDTKLKKTVSQINVEYRQCPNELGDLVRISRQNVYGTIRFFSPIYNGIGEEK